MFHISGEVKYFWALVVLIGISLTLQLIAIVFSVILYFKRYPSRKYDEQPGQDVEMTSSAAKENETTAPSGRSTDNIGVEIKGTEDLTDPLPPVVMRRLNDGLTVIALLVGILHLLKNGIHSGVM